jgi:hypothetical protein
LPHDELLRWFRLFGRPSVWKSGYGVVGLGGGASWEFELKMARRRRAGILLVVDAEVGRPVQ